MRAEIGFGGWCEMVMSLDESPVLRVGGTIGKSSGRSTVPSLKTRIHSGISATVSLLALVEPIMRKN